MWCIGETPKMSVYYRNLASLNEPQADQIEVLDPFGLDTSVYVAAGIPIELLYKSYNSTFETGQQYI